MKNNIFIIIIALLLSYTNSSAYDYVKAMDEGKNFFQIQTEANEYWNSRGITVDSPKEQRGGYKQFKRWEWFWTPRVSVEGKFPPLNINYTEYNQPTNKNKDKNSMKLQAFNPTWNFVGPTTSPGGYEGIGRINAVVEDPGYNGSTNQILWAGAASGGAWKSTNAGSSWSQMTANLGTLGVGDICINPNDGNQIYLATGDGDAGDAMSLGVFKSTNGGTDWNVTGFSVDHANNYVCRRLIMDPSNTNVLYLAHNGGIHKTTNGGTNWTQIFSTSAYDIELKPGTTSTIYASTYTAIYRSTDSGVNWTQLTSGLPSSDIARVALAVTPNATNNVYALYGNSNAALKGVYRSTDSGSNWNKIDDGSKNMLGWSANGSGTTGQSWYDLCIAVSPSNKDEIFIGGVNIWKTTDAGTSWNCSTMWKYDGVRSEVHADHHCLYYPNTNRLYSGHDGSINRTTNQGSSWSYIGGNIQCTQFYALGVSQQDSNYVICGAQDNSMFLKTPSSFGMTAATGDGFEGIIDYSNNNIMYCSSYNGNWSQTTDAGANWYGQSKPAGESGSWLTPYIINPKKNTVLYFGYKEVYLWKNGSYTKLSNWAGSSLNHLFISPSDTNTLWAGRYTAMYKTTNHGTNWSTISKPTSESWTGLCFASANPEYVWATFSGYSLGNKVFASTNGGSSWTNISGSLPNVPANWVTYQLLATGYRLWVATDIGVYYRNSTDSDWTKLSSGLPNVVVTQLEIQESGNILFASTYGRGLWKLSLKDGSPPSTPVLSKPLKGSSLIVTAPTLYWNSSSGSVNYEFQLGTDSVYTSPLYSVANITSTNSSQTNMSLSSNTNYFWRVRGKSIGGVNSPWSSSYYFTTGSCSISPKNIEVTLNMYGLTDGTTHKIVPVTLEFRTGSTLIGSTLVKEIAAKVGSNGKISADVNEIQDGQYYVIVRAAGYLPLATVSKVTISNSSTATYNFTTGYSQAAGGKLALYKVNGIYYMKPGDFNFDMKTDADDAAIIIENNGNSLFNIVPLR